MSGNVKSSNFFTVQGWMLNDLELKGNDLLVYAIIYGFTQTGNQWFTGSIKYLAEWTRSTKQGIQKNLENLLEKGLIEKKNFVQNNVNLVAYRTTELTESVQLSCKGCTTELHGGIQLSSQEYTTELHGGIQQSCLTHYNINNNISDNIDNKDNNNITAADKSASVCVNKSKTAFQKPTQTDIMVYITENQLQVNSVQFYNYYEANGWRVGKNPMRDWRAALRNWHINSIQKNQQQPKSNVEKYKFVINDFDDEPKESN